jgi:hypothetical protein
VRLAEGPKRAITVPAPTEKQRNSPTHQLTNSPTHQLTNSPPPPTAEADGAYYVEVHYPNGGYAILSGGSPEVLAELTAPLHSSYDVEITNTATGESHRLRLEYDTTVGGQRENVTIESERKIAEKDVSEKEERNDESKVS